MAVRDGAKNTGHVDRDTGAEVMLLKATFCMGTEGRNCNTSAQSLIAVLGIQLMVTRLQVQIQSN